MPEQIMDWDQHMAQVTTGSELVVTGSVMITDGASAGQARLDGSTEALNVMQYEHHEIHNGKHFFVNGYTTLGSAVSTNVCVQVSNGSAYPHFLYHVDGTGETQLRIYEYSDFAFDGTEVIPVNSNRNSSNVSALSVFVNSTINDVGSLIYSESFGLSSNPTKSVGGGKRQEDELVLGQNRKYILRITSASADNIVSYHGTWYEHTDKN